MNNERQNPMNDKKTDITILLPVYNEEKALPVVVEGIRAAMKDAPKTYEILVVDDKSTDGSAAAAERLGCRVIRHMSNRGAGASRKTGILASRGDIIVMIDADGSYETSDIPRILSFFPLYDQVNGARTGEKGTYPMLRAPAKWFIRTLASFLAGSRIPDLNTGMKAFKKEVMIPYLWTVPDGFSCVSSMTLAFLCNGHPVAYMPTRYHERIGKSKFHPLKDTYLYLLTVLRIITYFNPLKIFFPAAFLLLSVGVTKSLYDYFFVVHRLQLSDIVLVISGVVVGLQGLLADLVVAQARARKYESNPR